MKIIFPLLMLLLASCGENGHSHAEGGHHEGEHHHEEHGGDEMEVTLSDRSAANMDLKLGHVTEMALSESIATNGELELAPQNIADVHVLIGGIINDIRVIEGSKVKKGQVVATLRHPDIIKLQEDLINQNAQLNYAENEYLRQKKLYEEEVGSGREFQKIKAEYNGLKALNDALSTKLKMLGISPDRVLDGKIADVIYVKSPLDGKVSAVETNIGEFVSTDKRLFRIVDNKHIHAAFRIYENEILKIKEGQTIEFRSPSLPEHTFSATIYAISPVFEENPKNVHVHADLSHHDERLIPGMYISGTIKVDPVVRKVLPRSAIINDGNEQFVFVKEKHKESDSTEVAEHKHSETNYLKIPVKTGMEEDDWVELKESESLDAKAEVVLNGAYYLDAEMGKGETGHSH